MHFELLPYLVAFFSKVPVFLFQFLFEFRPAEILFLLNLQKIYNNLSAEEYYSEELILKNRLNQLKKEEQDVQYEREKLSSLRSLHIREMKRIQYEDVSKYRNNIELNGRYLLLNLIGKGGFSEVYKAYDYQDQMMVAIKIHQINPEWQEQKKSDYQKHARREAQIQKSIKHSKIIRLYDVFDVDINTFCTVMEYCEGNDLDLYLKQQNKNQISETEAKTVIMQIVQALKYLNELDKPVIHYDLKPVRKYSVGRWSCLWKHKNH